MDGSRLLAMLLVTIPRAVVLLVCTGVGGCLCSIILSAWRVGMTFLYLMNRTPCLASKAEDITALMI